VTHRVHVARRARQRGATLFVVVLAITLLTGVGLYSLHSSALVARASGNQREARQTEYLGELGTLTMLSDISRDTEPFLKVAASGQDDCLMNQGYDTTNSAKPACYKKRMADYVLPTPAAMFEPDSFGPYPEIEGSFHTELTDVGPAPWPVTGNEIGGLEFRQGKLTTIAILARDTGPGPQACTLNLMPIAAQHLTRSHVVLGPVRAQ